MANVSVYRSGQRRIIPVPCDSATVLYVGDMAFLNTDDAKPAADFTWDTDLATTQAGFADVFLGVSMMQSLSGDTFAVDIDVSADSEYEYAVASATYAIGTPLGPDKASGNALLTQTLETAVAASSVARSLRNEASAVTTLRVSFVSAYNPSANNAAGVTG